ncbi:MAG: glycosyltransferase, partial [Desulfovibrio sp.]|nr:glycosyltransferase [Desulfovibrio sp.]
MAELIALVYREAETGPEKAIPGLRASGLCQKIWLAGFREKEQAPGPDVEICGQEPEIESWTAAANRIAKTARPEAMLLLVSNLSEFSGETIRILARRLEANPELAGANPVFTTYDRAAISYLGTVADSLGYLHYLYEGLPRGNPLAERERTFQIGHPGLLLVRVEDIRRHGIGSGDLGFIGFCRDLAAARPGGFATVPQAMAAYENRAGQLRLLGVLNSLNMRGKIMPGTFVPDYFSKAAADNLEYGINAWLAEGPKGAWLCDCGDAWFRWRNDPKPETLLAWLSSLESSEAAACLNLVREYPCYLPAQFRWYETQAARKLAWAEEFGCAPLAEAIRGWQSRARSFHYGLLRKGMTLLKNAGIYNRSLDRCPAVYDAWLELAPAAQPKRVEPGPDWPAIAVAMPVYNPNLSFFRQAVESVRCQTYPNWQLCMADDASIAPEIRPMLEALASEDRRIRVVFRNENGHISRATNSALELVDAPWTAFMDNDDLLAPDALQEVARAASSMPDLKLIFSDFDHIDAD